MSETQTETDAEPTPGTWEHDLNPLDGIDGRSIFGRDKDGNLFVIANLNVPEQGLLEGDWRENARLIAAAGTAAQEAKEMGYDPQKAVEALPGLLAVLQDIDGMIEQLRYGTIRKMVNDVLASAEGSGE
ncbi:hypothetical protein [Salinibacter ruber]|uniref:hypothetical protein n=1 Tax=Salinibacter ruber TaxID=146919 RepID=UPI00216A0418|nr:hypothetical protein [Salinibacter ruber]MCS3610939.1 hypothetical protein [Salinibacter ruber]